MTMTMVINMKMIKMMNKILKMVFTGLTRNIPRFALVEVNFNHKRGVTVCHLLHQVLTYEFFISWMEPKSWWQICLYHAYVAHFVTQRKRDKEEREPVCEGAQGVGVFLSSGILNKGG